MLKSFLKTDFYWIVLVIFLLVAFVFYGFLAWSTPDDFYGNPKLILNSPDETANYFFSQLFAEQSTLKFYEPANDVAFGLVEPRSMRFAHGFIVPAGFIGLPLIYGILAKILTLNILPFLTPFFAVLGIFFFYLLLRNIFNRQTAFFSSSLALILPGYWYYSTRGFLPNVLFSSLVVIGLYFLIKAIKEKKLYNYFLFGIFAGLATLVRPADLVWLLLLWLLIFLFNLKQTRWQGVLSAFFLAVIVFLPTFYFNQQNFRNYLSFGYEPELGNTIMTQPVSFLEKAALPFGFHPRLASHNFINYTYGLFPSWTIVILAGLLLFLLINLIDKNKKELGFLAIFLLVSLYLVIYYGSWQFHDHPDPTQVTIGTSYVRYWLLIYLFSLPLLFSVLVKLLKRKALVLYFIFIALFLFLGNQSLRLVMFDPQEGILKVENDLTSYQAIYGQVASYTPQNAIIIADTQDKVFWPARRVIFRLNNEVDYQNLRKLIEAGYPVYYFYFSRSDDDLSYFSQKYFSAYGLKIDASILDFDQQSLYPVILEDQKTNEL